VGIIRGQKATMSTTEKRKAVNARNASTELYTALEELVELFEDSHAAELKRYRKGRQADPVLKLYDASIINARRALAKAKGAI